MIEAFSKYGPEWILVGILVAANLKLIFSIIKIVENNTSALTKLSDIVSRCSKNQD